MRTRSLLTTLACTVMLAGAGAETAFAASDASSQPSAVPSTSAPTTQPGNPAPPPGPIASPSALRTTAPPTAPSTSSSRPSQITAVPSGAPNTGVPPVASEGDGQAEAIGASLVVLLGGSGTLALRRRLKGRG